jgi:hypothetical protein
MNVGAATVSIIVIVCVCEPYVPVIVSVLVPIAAVLATVNRIVLLYVVGLEEKAAVTPLGRPEIERFTLPLKPF